MRRLSYLLSALLLVLAGAFAAYTGPLGGLSGTSEAAGVDAVHPYEFVTGSFEAKKDAGISFLISNPEATNASVVLQLFTATTQVGSNFTVNVQGRNTLTAILFATNTGLHFAKLSSSLPNVSIQYRHVDAASVTHFVDAGHVRAIALPPSGLFTAVTPFRLCDTRAGRGTQCDGRRIGPGGTLLAIVTGLGGVPASAKAVTLNVTVVGPSASGFVTLFPTGAARPGTSTVNFSAGQTIANGTTVKVGTSGNVSVYNALGTTDVLLDVTGYYV